MTWWLARGAPWTYPDYVSYCAAVVTGIVVAMLMIAFIAFIVLTIAEKPKERRLILGRRVFFLRRSRKMHNIKTKAVVNNPDGSLFYREEHEWNGLDDGARDWFVAKLKASGEHAHHVHKQHHGADSANLKVSLSGSLDGVAFPPAEATGVSYHALIAQQKHWYELGGELLKMGEGRLKSKK